jgi:hypothetical protein
MEFSAYREAVREQAGKLEKRFPTGYCIILSVTNEKKGSVAGVKTECRVFDAARQIVDETAVLFDDATKEVK